jgi:hypothetical protein
MRHAELGELMSEHAEVAIGIIRILCRRLRNINAKLLNHSASKAPP